MKGDIRINLPLLKNRDTGPHEKFKKEERKEKARTAQPLTKKQAWSMLQLGWKKPHTETKTRFLDDRSWKIKKLHYNPLPKTGGRRQKQWKLFRWKEIRTV